ncbi:DUF5829 family protein [Streptomyces sp. CRN 30]|uniref:DUF5829 family protein n=1 Tax=Streptomyces sp. CRN 30 TaxID=3075613 RepID=UPI002A82CE61|nr:DUF5829 family protein [Streptomyces sp. CRN 30]
MILIFAVALTGVTGAGAVARAETGHQRLLYFNHAYGVFDRETADAIENSAYLREFANFTVRTTTGADGQTWTGRYLMGRETYVELFGVGDLPGQDGTLGSGGLGVSTERSGDLDTVSERLTALGTTPIPFLQTRDFGDGVPVPWFDALLTTETYDAFGAWAMEYRPEYFADPRGNTEPASGPGDVGRERYLSDDYAGHLMRDVTGVRLAVTEGDLADTLPLLRAGGFDLRSPEGGGVVAKDGMTTLRFDVVPREEAGLRHLSFSLNHSVTERHVEQLGNSTLVVGPGAGAEWSFDAAQP